jgi:hypothetical protein
MIRTHLGAAGVKIAFWTAVGSGSLYVGCNNGNDELADGPGGDVFVGPGNTSSPECVDEDEDGFGRNCAGGADCDDGNASITTSDGVSVDMKPILPTDLITLDYHGTASRIRPVIYGRILPVTRRDAAMQYPQDLS